MSAVRTKSWEAILIGVALWGGGAALLILLGGYTLFPALAPPAVLILVPLLYLVTRFHLRDVPMPDRVGAGLRLSILATAVQCPLDAFALMSIFYLGYPELTISAQRATVFALLIGYFCLLVVPWSVGARAKAV